MAEIEMSNTRYTFLLWFLLLTTLSVQGAEEPRLEFTGDAGALSLLWSQVLVHATPERLLNSSSGSSKKLQAILKGKPHAHAILLIDNALKEPQLIDEQKPVARLVLQRAAWATFDWLAETHYRERLRPEGITKPATPEWAVDTDAENTNLRNLLARLIRRLALTEDQIDRLPNNYTTQPLTDAGERIRLANRLELPEDLFKREGPWLQLVYWSNNRIGVAHEVNRGNRSESLLFLRLPGGRGEGLEFIESFNERARQEALPLLPDVGVGAKKLPGAAPVVPSGTQMLLLTRMLAILPSGELVSTPLIESIELNDATSMVNPRSGVGPPMKNAAFHLSYQHLLDDPEETSLRRMNATEPFMGATFLRV
jgi:hypothetical protein